jgi:uncharacterized protein YggE
MSKWFALFISMAAAATLPAQSVAPGTVQATGTAILSVNPNQVSIDVTVTTQGASAQAAATQNASQTTTVINALKQVLGTNGTVQTINYSVYPNYSNAPGQSGVIAGYTASNSVRATTPDLTLPGPLIDTANQAGASSVGNLTFSLQDPDPTTQQALSAAAKQAQAHATAIATGLGAKTGTVVSAQQNSSVSTPIGIAGTAAGSTQTPVLTGMVTVSASVVITVQLLQ